MAAAAASIVGSVAGFAGNLLSCGTVTQIGCVKLNQATGEETAWQAAIQAVYAVETGGATPDQAAQAIAGYDQQLQQLGVGRGGSFAGFCGATGWAQSVGNPWAGIPQTSRTYRLLCPAVTGLGSIYDLLDAAANATRQVGPTLSFAPGAANSPGGTTTIEQALRGAPRALQSGIGGFFAGKTGAILGIALVALLLLAMLFAR